MDKMVRASDNGESSTQHRDEDCVDGHSRQRGQSGVGQSGVLSVRMVGVADLPLQAVIA